MSNTGFDSDSENILFFGDPNLGEEGFQRFSAYFPHARQLTWEKGTDKTAARKKLRSQSWLFTLSFYNDYIFSCDDFDFLGLLLNIHPSLPSLRGVGYDHIPLIENHQEHGATLHFLRRPSRNRFIVKSDIDAGRIIRTRTRKLSPQATYGDIRILNQQIALEMLEELSEQLLAWGDIETVYRKLSAEAEKSNLAWAERYIDSSTLQKMLRELRTSHPGHRVFMKEPLLLK
ncbi:MAG: hypothetical protein C1941_04030 [Prosthecochloris sp.]|nr:hypothetical protein [Prosthecochloris sp.]